MLQPFFFFTVGWDKYHWICRTYDLKMNNHCVVLQIPSHCTHGLFQLKSNFMALAQCFQDILYFKGKLCISQKLSGQVIYQYPWWQLLPTVLMVPSGLSMSHSLQRALHSSEWSLIQSEVLSGEGPVKRLILFQTLYCLIPTLLQPSLLFIFVLATSWPVPIKFLSILSRVFLSHCLGLQPSFFCKSKLHPFILYAESLAAFASILCPFEPGDILTINADSIVWSLRCRSRK